MNDDEKRAESRARGLYWDRALSYVEGCSPVSAGCRNCWAAAQTKMRAAQSNPKIVMRYHGLNRADGAFNGCVRVMDEALNVPTSTKIPTVFCVWNDLFHPGVEDDAVRALLGVAAHCPRHTFLILTKRPERMAAFFAKEGAGYHPLPNVWLGTTIEEQQFVDRLDWLMQCPAAGHWVSVEPMLGSLQLTGEVGLFKHRPGLALDAVVCGGETGRGARPMHPDWPLELAKEMEGARIPFLFKGWGEWCPESVANSVQAAKSALYVERDGATRPAARGPRGQAVTVQRVGRQAAGRHLGGILYDTLPWYE